MSPAHETLVKKVVVLTSLIVLASSVGFLLVACGGSSSSAPREQAGSTSAGWRRLAAAPIAVDAYLTSVWTGKEVIVDGVGGVAPDGNLLKSYNVAEAYNPTSDTWRRLSRPLGDTTDPVGHAAVWTGKEMLVWGAFKSVAFNPLSNSWRLLPKAPTGQGIAVWTGREMIGWGGGCCGDANSDGAAYSPSTNSWRKLAPSPLAPAQRPIGAWTGRELILFVSGLDPDGKPVAGAARGAAYDPATDTWRRLAPLPESGLRFGGTAVWDGREVLVVGAGPQQQSAFAYRPATNRWRRLASPPRAGGSAVWTGRQLLLWEGRETLAYDPKTGRWSTLPHAPLNRRDGSTVTWTGRSLVVWGGVIGTPLGTNTPTKYLTDGAAFTPAPERSGR